MGLFQASLLEAMKSLRDKFQTLKNTSTEVEVDQTFTSASKPGTSNQTENVAPNPQPRTKTSHSDEAMVVDLYGPSLPPRLRGDHSMHDSDPRHISDHHSDHSEEPSRVVLVRPKNMQIRESTRLGPDMYLSHHL